MVDVTTRPIEDMPLEYRLTTQLGLSLIPEGQGLTLRDNDGKLYVASVLFNYADNRTTLALFDVRDISWGDEPMPNTHGMVLKIEPGSLLAYRPTTEVDNPFLTPEQNIMSAFAKLNPKTVEKFQAGKMTEDEFAKEVELMVRAAAVAQGVDLTEKTPEPEAPAEEVTTVPVVDENGARVVLDDAVITAEAEGETIPVTVAKPKKRLRERLTLGILK